MPADSNIRAAIKESLDSFLNGELKENALRLLEMLGYRSNKTTSIQPNTPEGFKQFLAENRVKNFNDSRARLEEWQSVDLLFQLTDDEIRPTVDLFGSSSVDITDKCIKSYLFFAIGLDGAEYSRTKLAEITREINKVFPMPVMIIFRHGETLTFSIIDRRVHRREESKDVLGKVTDHYIAGRRTTRKTRDKRRGKPGRRRAFCPLDRIGKKRQPAFRRQRAN